MIDLTLATLTVQASGSSDHICNAYVNTYGLPIITSHCVNAVGQKQDVRKYCPKLIKMIMNDEKVTIHAFPGCQRSGFRQYVHYRNIAAACMFLRDNAKAPGKFNIPGQCEISNLELGLMVAKYLGKELKYELKDVHSRPPRA